MNSKFRSPFISRLSLTIILACIHFFSFGTAISSTAGGGNWTLTTTWVGGVVPVLGDDVTIVNGATVNLTTNQSCNSLTLNGSGILNMNTATRTLTVTTGVTLSGTSTIQGTGFDRIINAATLTVSAAATASIQDIQINTSGAATLNGQVSFTVGNSASKSFASMVINTGGVLNMSVNSVTVGVVGSITINGTGAINGNNNNRIVNAGSLSVASGATAVIQNVQLNVTNAVTIDGTLTLNTGNTATKSFGSLTINSPSGTFTNTANNVPITINGSMVNNGTFSQGTGRVTFKGATSNTVTGTAATTAFGGGITINKGVSQANILDVQCAITMVAGGLILTNGTFELTNASTITPFTADPAYGATARLWCNGGTMTSTASINWTFSGTLQVSAGSVTVGTAADDTIFANNGSAGTINISGGTLTVTGRIRGGSNWNYIMSGGVADLGTIGNTAGFYPFTMNTAGSQFTMTGGTIIIERPDTGTPNGGYNNISSTGTFTGGTLQIGGASTQAGNIIGIDTTVPIYNLTVNSANVTAQVQTQAITVSNNVTISSGTLTANGFNITVGGNWTNNGTFTPTTPAVGVTFNSSTASQTIGGTSVTTFYRLVLNNTFAAMPQFTLGRNTGVSATGRLTMTSGVVDMAGFSFTIANSASGALVHTLASTAGWMYGGGFVRAVPASAIVIGVLPANNVDGFFPVGTLVDFRPFFIGKSNTVNSNGNITVTHTRLATVTTVSIADGTTIISRRDDSWAVSHSGSAGTYGIRYGGTNLGVVFSLAHLHSCLAASVVGTHVPATSISLTDPRVERSALTFAQFNGSTFYVGSDNVLSSLPIELLNFSAVLQPGGVELNWATASELNNDFFTIERAADIEKFEKVKIVNGQGTKGTQTNYSEIDESPLVGTSYYRLKQTDYDGNTSYSAIRKVEVVTGRPRFTVYPNPAVDNRFNFELTGANPGDEVPINVLNSAGISVFESSFKADQNGRIKANVDLGALSGGLYIVRIKATIGMAQKIIIQ